MMDLTSTKKEVVRLLKEPTVNPAADSNYAITWASIRGQTAVVMVIIFNAIDFATAGYLMYG